MATQAQRTSLVSGWFDCRIYKNGVAKEARPMKPDGDTIAFSIGFSEYPKEFANFGGAEFIKETLVNNLKRWYVSIKVGKICAFFDAKGNKIDRPTNAELDNKRFDAIIQYKVLQGDKSKMEARGFWADAMQLRPSDELKFAPMEDAAKPTASVVTDKPQGDIEQPSAMEAPAGDDLPF